jgi:hypothetical protein
MADQHYARYLQGITTDHLRELNYADQKALHNFKYFTWVEQQGRTSQDVVDEWDRLIDSFNNATGLQDNE